MRRPLGWRRGSYVSQERGWPHVPECGNSGVEGGVFMTRTASLHLHSLRDCTPGSDIAGGETSEVASRLG